MKFVRIIDSETHLFVADAFVVSYNDAVVTDEETTPASATLSDGTIVPRSAIVETPCPGGFYCPKWDGTWDEENLCWNNEAHWIEGGSAPVPTEEELALQAKQNAVNELIDGGAYTLPDELHRQDTASSIANDTLASLFEYLAECFPDKFGV